MLYTFIYAYKLSSDIINGHIYFEIEHEMHGWPKAAWLGNYLLQRRLEKHNYYEKIYLG